MKGCHCDQCENERDYSRTQMATRRRLNGEGKLKPSLVVLAGLGYYTQARAKDPHWMA